MQKYLGSCLCNQVSFEVVGEFEKFFFCHCSRCRKQTGTAHGANLFSQSAEVNWLAGEELVKLFKLPETRFEKSFCRECGSALPTVKAGKGIVVPAGSLDCDIETRPDGHIHMGSRANWDSNLEKVASFDIYP